MRCATRSASLAAIGRIFTTRLPLGVRVRAIQQRLHVREPVRGLRIVPAHHRRTVIENDDALEVDVTERLHDLPHVVVAVVHERFDKMRQRGADVAEMDLPDLPRAEISNHLLGILSRQLLAALEPGPATQADADVRAVSDLHRPLVALEVAKDASGNAGKHGHRRVVRMDADVSSAPLRYRRNLLDEVRVVLPDLVLAKHPSVGKRARKHLAIPIAARVRAVLVELARRRTPNRRPTTGPDTVAHVRIRRIGDTRLAEIAHILFVFLNLLIAPGQVQRDLRHVVHARVADVVDRDSGIGVALLDLNEAFGRAEIGRGGHADVLGAELFEEQQLFVRRRRGRLDAEFDCRTSLWCRRPSALAGECGRPECAERDPAEIATIDTAISRGIWHDRAPSAHFNSSIEMFLNCTSAGGLVHTPPFFAPWCWRPTGPVAGKSGTSAALITVWPLRTTVRRLPRTVMS